LNDGVRRWEVKGDITIWISVVRLKLESYATKLTRVLLISWAKKILHSLPNEIPKIAQNSFQTDYDPWSCPSET
jgi:hypothetical protein